MTGIVVFAAMMIALALQAALRGGAPERIAAASLAAAALVTWFANGDTASTFTQVQWDVLWIDAGLLCVLLAIALTADRFWPMWIAAFQLVTVAGHGARGYAPDILPSVYWWLLGKTSYPMMALLCIGIERHQRRLREGLPEFAWTRHRHHIEGGEAGR